MQNIQAANTCLALEGQLIVSLCRLKFTGRITFKDVKPVTCQSFKNLTADRQVGIIFVHASTKKMI